MQDANHYLAINPEGPDYSLLIST
uniref:Uncharacterized protein n=1 Tax=Anguilla anguilla TaxID=7936 RepID=A0A0E9P8H4_ANGAN